MTKAFNDDASKKLITEATAGRDIGEALKAGANPNYRDDKGYSAMDYATGGRRDDHYKSYNSSNIKALLEADVNPYEKGPNGKNAVENVLHEVVHGSQIDAAFEIGRVLRDRAEKDGHPNPQEVMLSTINVIPQQNMVDDYIAIGDLQMIQKHIEAKLEASRATTREEPAVAGPRASWKEGFANNSIRPENAVGSKEGSIGVA